MIAQPQQMPGAFFGRYRLMAIDGTVFNTPDTLANAAAFGRSRNQYGSGAYPQVRCVLLARAQQRGHALGALQAGIWEHLDKQRQLSDGSVLAWLSPTRKGQAQYPFQWGCGCVSSPIASRMNDWEKRARSIDW